MEVENTNSSPFLDVLIIRLCNRCLGHSEFGELKYTDRYIQRFPSSYEKKLIWPLNIPIQVFKIMIIRNEISKKQDNVVSTRPSSANNKVNLNSGPLSTVSQVSDRIGTVL